MTTSITHFAFALHGGAGVTPGRDYRRAEDHMARLTAHCRTKLAAGESALDVVEFAVRDMEASGLYVAGRGSAQNDAGYVELDASIMDGARRRAGAIAAARDIVSPIEAARCVMEKSDHILLVARGAELFARAHGLAIVEDPAHYYVLPTGVEAGEAAGATTSHGTVGAVALDQNGRLAAATSTGGIFGKSEGRVGDTPLIGSGTWADHEVAISCTGWGECFMLAGGAQDVASRIRYAGSSLQDAVDGLISDVGALGGDGGVIALNRSGEIAFSFNSPGMKRASCSAERSVRVGVYTEMLPVDATGRVESEAAPHRQ